MGGCMSQIAAVMDKINENVVVTCAGCKVVNGQYHHKGDSSGRPKFEKSDGMELWWNGTEWHIGKTDDVYYHKIGGEHPSGEGVWKVYSGKGANSDAKEPVPQVAGGGMDKPKGIVMPHNKFTEKLEGAIHDNVVIDRAGCNACNGRYKKQGATNDRPMFEKSDGSGMQVWWTGEQWRIGKSNDYYYFKDGGEHPTGFKDKDWKLYTGDNANSDASEPAPDVAGG